MDSYYHNQATNHNSRVIIDNQALLLLPAPHNLFMTADGYILIPKNFYVKEQPLVAPDLHDKSLKFKNS